MDILDSSQRAGYGTPDSVGRQWLEHWSWPMSRAGGACF